MYKKATCVTGLILSLALAQAAWAVTNLVKDGSFEMTTSTYRGGSLTCELGACYYWGDDWGNADTLTYWDKSSTGTATTRSWYVTDGGANVFPDGDFAYRLDARSDMEGTNWIHQDGIVLRAGMEYLFSIDMWTGAANDVPHLWVQLVKGTTVIKVLDDVTTVGTDRKSETKTASFKAPEGGSYRIQISGDVSGTTNFHPWVDNVILVPAVSTPAGDPNPADQATDVLRDTVLTWTAGEFAKTHDVYFGTVFADVNSASRTSPNGVLASRDQADTQFNPGRLQFGQTYFWRVDEVNAPPDNTIFKGDVWSFTVEPVAYPVDGKTITVTASSATPGQSPENTVNGTGMTSEQHGTDLATMWLTAQGATGPAWIQYQFDRLLKLHEMWVWNHNGMLETILGFGAKDVTVEYSVDGITFQAVGTPQQLARASGKPDYTHNTTVSLGDVAAKYIRLTIQNNWGGILPQYGLSEVRFFAVPMVAREPSPKSGTASLFPQVTLSWRAGREAGSHQVLLGTDPNNLTLAATVQKPSYDTAVNLNQTYYWKIAEVNQAKDPSTWTSDVWSFSTLPYLVVEDFESYTDEDGKAVWQTWIDGYGIATNGSQVGNANPPYAERTIIHGGKQAMPLFYDNTSGATYSEAKRTFANPQNWASYGIKSLTFYFLGQAANTGRLYVKINNTRVDYAGDAGDVARPDWQPFVVDLSKVTSGLQSVTSLTIGVDGAASKGTLYLDDIRLYPQTFGSITSKDPGNANLVGYWNFDAGSGTVAADTSGKGRNGTITNATWDTGKFGSALRFSGMGAYVELPAAAFSTISQQATVSVWLYIDSKVSQTPFTFAAFRDPAVNNSRVLSAHVVYNGTVYFDSGGDTAGYNRISKTIATYEYGDAWTHWAFVKNAQTGEQKIYRNGLLWQSGTGMTRTMTGVTVFTLGVAPSKTANFWTGVMDDFRLYDRALSPEEIAALAGRTGPFVQPF